MSSDEEGDPNPDSGERRYHIIEKSDWRSPELTAFLRALDKLKVNMDLMKSGGNHFRVRLVLPESQQLRSVRRPTRKLPRNFYRLEFLAALNEFETYKLAIRSADEFIDLKGVLDEYVFQFSQVIYCAVLNLVLSQGRCVGVAAIMNATSILT